MNTAKDLAAERIAEAAADWFAQSRETELSAAARERFAAWLAESPVHVREYLAVTETWGAMQRAQIWPADSAEQLLEFLHETRPNVSSLRDGDGVGDVQGRTNAAGAGCAGAAEGEFKRSRSFWAIAASVLLAILSLALITSFNTPTKQTFTTARGEQRSIVLPDGSIMQLNTLTRAIVRFTPQRRSIELPEGEAFFRVAQDKQRPFEVITPSAVVRALGTEFNVHSRARGTRVAVVEGRVRVTPRAAASSTNDAANGLTLLARDAAELSSSGGSSRTQLTRPDLTTAWLHRRLVFDNQPVSQAVEEFNRYNTRQMRIESSALESLRISGVFDADDPGALVKYLRRIHAVEVERAGNVSILR